MPIPTPNPCSSIYFCPTFLINGLDDLDQNLFADDGNPLAPSSWVIHKLQLHRSQGDH